MMETMRLRIGAFIWVLSWVPYGLILGLSGFWFTAAWAFEITLGLIGIAIAGSAFSKVVKREGWRGAPSVLWRTLRYGESERMPT